MMEHRAQLRIGQVAAKSGVSIDAIRYYERLGLLPEAPRTRGGFRLYSKEQVDRLLEIRRAQTLGLSLKEIREVVNPSAARQGREHCASVRAILDGRLRELDERLAELHRLRDGVAKARAACEDALTSQGYVCCPVIDCADAGIES